MQEKCGDADFQVFAFLVAANAVLFFRVSELDASTMQMEFIITVDGVEAYRSTKTMAKLATHIDSENALLTLGINTTGNGKSFTVSKTAP